MNIDSISRDIITDRYGDITLYDGDINTSRDRIAISKENTHHRIRTGHGDMYLYRFYGANLESYIGKKITEDMIESMKSSIRDSLMEDLFLPPKDIDIIAIHSGNSIFFKINVGQDNTLLNNKFSEINIEFDTIEGITHVR